MEIANLVLEFIKVILSAPVIAGVVVLRLAMIFRAEISSFLGRLFSVKLPGFDMEASQAQRLRLEPAAPASIDPPAPSAANPSPGDHALAARAENHAAKLWEFRYINMLLVRKTQFVLDWINSCRLPPTISIYNARYLTSIPEAFERRAVLEVLERHELVEFTAEGLMKMTQKGKDYLEFRGPIPPLDEPPPAVSEEPSPTPSPSPGGLAAALSASPLMSDRRE